ncbi:glycosyltransferase [Schaalia sp. lx-260]|uniref:glycosyltransferase n=1 Tax=Schaalia sp. lx-260 TaxID=2899082 RepID=UPI001E38CE08|nr:glycosyltransferase [Schaalia sp. lx-260]
MGEQKKQMQIAAVVVTFNRLSYLQRLIPRLLDIQELDAILIVDNASTDGTPQWLSALNNERVKVHLLEQNMGGAGGFHVGLEWSYSLGYELTWMMDDDGLPDLDCLGTLLEYRNDFDFWGPAVLAEQNPEKLCFPVRVPRHATASRTLAELVEYSNAGSVEGVVIPFNGVLVKRSLVEKIGVPRAEFFIWGDDVEYLWRAARAGARVATVVDAHFLHPATDDLGAPMMFGKTTYNHSPSDLKHYCMARNNTVNLLEYRSILHVIGFWVKTAWFYTFVVPSMSRWKISVSAIWAGLRKNFTGHKRFLRG